MFVAIAVSASTHGLANKWLDKCAELGGIENTELLILCPANLQLAESSERWGKLTRIRDRSAQSGWPFEMNGQFVQLAWNLFYSRRTDSWLLCDPRCPPKAADWLARIEAAYLAGAKAFMVQMVPGAAGESPHPVPICVLPPDAVRENPDAVSEKRPRLPWYVRGAHEFTPKRTTETHIFAELFDLQNLVEPTQPTVHAPAIAITRDSVAERRSIPLLSMSELFDCIRLVVRTEDERRELMEFLRSAHFHLREFGAAVKDLANVE
jgi:hypothetical protein